MTDHLHDSPFIDAQEMHRRHPDTVAVPSDAALAALAPGCLLRVCPEYERIWVRVESVDHEDDEIVGHVHGNPLCSDKHGFRGGDRVVLHKRHVVGIREPASE